MHKEIESDAARTKLFETEFTTEDIDHLRTTISSLCVNGCTAVPGLAHVHNKIAARVDAPLLTDAEDEADPNEHPEYHDQVQE